MKRYAVLLMLFFFFPAVTWATISSTTTQVVYTCNGSTTVFAYTFKIFASEDLYVASIASTGLETQITTGFTVSGAGVAGGGNVTFSSAPASGTILLLQRKIVQHQELDLVPNARISAATLEASLDKLTMICQDLQNQINRCVKFKPNTAVTAIVPLPEPAASKYLKWNSGATYLENAN